VIRALLAAIELFKLENDVNVVHVPYRGTGPLLNGIQAGEVQIVADPSTTSLPGKMRSIATAGAECGRSRAAAKEGATALDALIVVG